MNDDYDIDNLGERPTPVVWEPRRSAGADLMGFGVCALIVAVLVFTALWQVTS